MTLAIGILLTLGALGFGMLLGALVVFCVFAVLVP